MPGAVLSYATRATLSWHQLEEYVLRPLPKDEFPERLQMLATVFHSEKMIARKLPHFAGKAA